MATDTQRPPLKDVPVAGATEYRGVSVLFADMAGSTEFVESLGPEGYGDLLRSFHALCNDVVRRHHGVVAQYQGDGIICYFGFPRAVENDALRAVQSGLDILGELQALAAQTGVALRSRIGISTGSAMIRADGDHFGTNAVGACINRAARLEALAEPDTLLICDDTRQLIGASFQLTDLGPQTLKGFRSPQKAYRVIRRRSGVATRFEALRGGRQGDLIGRQDELSRLLAHFDAARGGSGRTVMVSADAGFGKSRVISAFRHHRKLENVPGFVLQCLPEQTSAPLYPVRQFLEWVAGVAGFDAPEVRHAKLERLFSSVWRAEGEDLATLLELLSPLAPPPRPDQADSAGLRRQRALRLLSRMLFGSVRGRGAFVVVLEDAHWVDPTTAELVEILVADAPAHPGLLLVTSRPEPPWADGIPGAAEVIALKPLSDNEAAALVRQSLGDHPLTDEGIALIVAKSEGVPLFLEEYSDMLRHRDDRASGGPDVPLTLGGLVQSKLDRLDPRSRAFARAASAIGRSFDLSLIAALTDEAPEDSTAHAEALLAQNLVERPSSTDPSSHLTFRHALIRDAIHAGMSRDDQRRLHDRIANHFLAQGGAMSVAEHVLAMHLARAGRPAEAVARYMNAALSAAGQGAAAEALGHLEDALLAVEALPPGIERDTAELSVRSIQGPTQMVTRGPGNPAFGATQARAMDLVERLGLHEQMVPVTYSTALHAWATADLGRALQISEAIAGINARSPSDGATLAASTMRGLVNWHLGNNVTALEFLGQTVARYNPEVHRDLYSVFLKDFGVFSHFYLGLTHTVRGEFAEGANHAARAAELGATLGFPHARGFGMLARFNTAMLRGDEAAADAQSSAALDFARQQGFPEFVAMATFVQGWVKARHGNGPEAIALMTQGLSAWEATGFTCWQPLFAAYLASDLVANGQIPAATALLDRYEGAIDGSGENQARAPLLLSRAKALAAEGLTDRAAATAARARAVAQAQGARLWQDRIEAWFPGG
ncbi:adenylate/guanylate cyclase domain-containing protein [Phaeovulum sp. NW3]|uniref:ATP-binding protein n=1 Tax=Phaeovulum sp. NW3 TaxID=2934933 RepID=UPI00201FD430|nr:adenylate/guanylate cyclase domain-containing protein [Phaeovulum sp. NW3]MCL7466654.1 AAA family ATPase [Phaeovulum sp. NW3]